MQSLDQLRDLLDRRIVVIDGAMGTMIQSLNIGLADEATWRGTQFANHGHSVKGCTDLLCITQPDAIEGIHYQFLKAGADNPAAKALLEYLKSEAAKKLIREFGYGL